MLLLNRYPSQAIIISFKGETVKVVVTEVEGEKVTLGCDADKSVTIDREEIHLRKNQDNNGNR